MNYSFSITTKKGDEYRIMLIDADISMPSGIRFFKYTYYNKW